MVPYELREGTVFAGDYRVVSPLARGGMGAVYVVDQISTGKRRALKVMSPMLADNPKARERFVQEAKVGGLVDSAHVVEVIAAGIDEPTEMPWLVMELLEGETLADRVERSPDMPLEALLRIVDQVLDVLTACHRKGVIHRDIKPENLFLLTNGKVKVLDFGIARVREGVRTVAGTMLGTVAFMPPEQLRGSDVDSRADLFAVGATMFSIIAGRRVHMARDDSELAMLMLTRAAPRLLTVASDVPENLALVVDRALAFLPERRYPDAQTMRGDVWALQKNQRPPYAYACEQAQLAPDVLELPETSRSTAKTTPDGKKLPPTDPKMPAYKPGGGPVTSADLPRFDRSQLPATDPQLPAFMATGSDSVAPVDSAALAGEEPASTREEAAPPSEATPSEAAPSEATPSEAPPSESAEPSGSESPASASDAPASAAPSSEGPPEEAAASQNPLVMETNKRWPAAGSTPPAKPQAKAEPSDADEAQAEAPEQDEAPLSDPPPSQPPIEPPPARDAKEVARAEGKSGSMTVTLLVLLVVAVGAAWYL
ncbi:MAG: protein kinase, partial [Myxococcales bacterium]|nr:protein kinase [Myxococcales bacterium]